MTPAIEKVCVWERELERDLFDHCCLNPPDQTYPGPPQEMAAQLKVAILNDSNAAAGTLNSLLLKAVVGVARLYIPQSLQVPWCEIYGLYMP